MGATMARFAKVIGPRGEVRVNSEKRWLTETPKTKKPAEKAGFHRNQSCARTVASGRQVLVSIYVEIFGFAFFEFGVVRVNFFF